MLRLRYEPVDLFRLVHTLPELAGCSDLAMDPLLATLDQVLDDQKLLLLAWNGYVTRRPHCLETGRDSTPVEALLRLQVLRRLYGWSYDQVRTQVKGSLALRQFTRLYGHPVPSKATLDDWALALHPATVRSIHRRIVQIGVREHVTQGQKLRSDGTVTETNIHYPTDSSLLSDSVRVLGRMLTAARRTVGRDRRVSPRLFVNHTRSTKRLAREIARAVRKRQTVENTPKIQRRYRKLLRAAQETVEHVQTVMPILEGRPGHAERTMAQSLRHYLPLVRRVIDQTERRVLRHESVPAREKLVSLFEPHTQVIRRGKPAPRETEFGRKIWLDEVDGGLISDYRVLVGNPPDAQAFAPSVKQHRKLFHHSPKVVATDRGASSPANESAAQRAGVAEVCLPAAGHRTPERIAYERQAWFRLGERFRAGVEGRISVLKRARQLDRCRDHGEPGFEKWIGWGCLVNNLVLIARALLRRQRRRRATVVA